MDELCFEKEKDQVCTLNVFPLCSGFSVRFLSTIGPSHFMCTTLRAASSKSSCQQNDHVYCNAPLKCSHDVDVHLLFRFDIDLHILMGVTLCAAPSKSYIFSTNYNAHMMSICVHPILF